MPLVSVLMPTYRHEAFLAQAIDSVLAQRIDFDLKILIGEDGSDDGTADICRDYERRFPDKIHVTYRQRASKNDYHDALPGRENLINMYRRAEGEFVALLEGDDYWIDDEKLQVQIDHLRAHPEQSFCFTNAWDDHPSGKRADYVRRWLGNDNPRDLYHLADIVATNFIPTAGVVYRRACLPRIPAAFHSAAVLDWILYVELAKSGPFSYLDRMSAVRRIHPGGVISMKDRFSTIDTNLDLLKEINEMTDHRFADIVLTRRGELDRMAIQHAVDTGTPERGAKYLRDLLKHPQLRKSTGTRDLVRSSVLIHTPVLARIIHRLRGGRT